MGWRTKDNAAPGGNRHTHIGGIPSIRRLLLFSQTNLAKTRLQRFSARYARVRAHSGTLFYTYTRTILRVEPIDRKPGLRLCKSPSIQLA